MDPLNSDVGSAKDAPELVCRSFGCVTRAIDTVQRTVDVVMSTDSIDRYGERVEQDWDLEAFVRNPVCIWSHSTNQLPIGRVENVRVRSGALEGTIHFASATANPMAEQCFQLFRERVLNAVSVGFIPHSFRIEKDDDKEVLVLSKNELVELSVTSTPANKDALAKMRARAMHETPKQPQQQTLPIEGANKEPDMDTKDLEQKIKELDAAVIKSECVIATTTKALETANAKVTELAASIATSEKSLAEEKAKSDATEKRAKAAEEAVVKASVEALVGKKITPAELEDFQALAVENPERYKSMIAKRADLPMATHAVVVPAEKGIPVPPTATGGGSDALAGLIDKANGFAPIESYGSVSDPSDQD